MHSDNVLGLHRSQGRSALFNAQLDITTFQLELGYFLFLEETYKFLDLFEVHSFLRRSSPLVRPARHKKMRSLNTCMVALDQSVISSLEQGVRISQPRSVTSTVSSMRTPNSPGM